MARRYRRYKRNPAPLDMLFDVIFGVAVLLGTLLFKLFKGLWHSRYKFPRLKINQNIHQTVPMPSNVGTSQPIIKAEDVVEQRYGLRDSLLTPTEKAFLVILQQIVGDKYHIELQVQLSRIVSPLDSNAHFTNYHDFNKISAKSIDFVLYDKEYKPYLAIELDDRSHFRWDRIKRDSFVNDVMKSVSLRIIHVPVSYSYDLERLRTEILGSPIAAGVGV